MTFDKDAKSIQWGKINLFSTSGIGIIGHPQVKECNTSHTRYKK